MSDQPEKMYRCPRRGCDAEFPTSRRLAGHVGGKHGRIIALSQIPHGTVGGYKKELARGIPTCSKCRRAWRTYIRNRRAEKGDAA